MLDRIKAIFTTWHSLREADSLSDAELADLGLTRSQMAFLARMPADVPARMAQMAAVFGISREDLQKDHAGYVELLEVCGHCGARNACGKFLAQGAAATPARADFCPNTGIYTAMTGLAAE